MLSVGRGDNGVFNSQTLNPVYVARASERGLSFRNSHICYCKDVAHPTLLLVV